MATTPNDFDPYYKWLGIPPKDQPPHYYRLLGVEPFESDRDVIEVAANKHMAYLRRCATGERAHYAEKLLTELAAARLCLLDLKKKAAYDTALSGKATTQAVQKLCSVCGVDVTHSHRTKDGQGHYFCDACWAARNSPKQEADANPLAALAATQAAAPTTAAKSGMFPPKASSHPKTVQKAAGKSSPKKSRMVAILSVVAVILLAGIFALYQLLFAPSSKPESPIKVESELASANVSKESDYPKVPQGAASGELFPEVKNKPHPAPANPVPTAQNPITPGNNVDTEDHTKPEVPATPTVKPDETPAPEPVNPAPEPAPAATAVIKVPAPSGASLKAALQLVKDSYQKDLVAARTLEEKGAVVNKMILDSSDTKDTVARFALLSKAMDFAINNGDVDGAFAIIDQLDSAYELDGLNMRTDAVKALLDVIQSVNQLDALMPKVETLVQAALTADRYDVAKSVAENTVVFTRATKDTEAQHTAIDLARKVRETQAAYMTIKTALATLAANPADPDANLKVGKFKCLIKDDWNGGLPMLAHGSDPALKTLATQEIAGAGNAASQMILGDGWWTAADKETGYAKSQIQDRAEKWYSAAVEGLTGGNKIKVEMRLKTLASLAAAGPTRTINLLKLVDVTRDAVAGKWEFRNGAWVSDNSQPATLQFPYQPPAEYDYRVVFTKSHNFAIVCSAMGHQFYLQILGQPFNTIGFGFIGGKESCQNPTAGHFPAGFVDGQQYTALVKVRKGGLQAFINGQLITECKTDYSDIDPNRYWPLNRDDLVGLGSWSSPTVYSSAEIIEITGKGHVLKREEH